MATVTSHHFVNESQQALPQQHHSVSVYRKDIDPGDDNPFRPGSELSREADFIVNLIKEGKPITPTGELMINANHTESSQQSPINHEQVAKLKNRQQTQSKLTQKSDENVDISEKSPSDRSKISVEPGQHIDIQHGVVVSPKHGGQTIEKVTIRKRKKCCSIQ
ncbi:hypothetical protein SSS_06178 [Sarcoptes scabiei]|uniref:Uncharacterized protein n=1 Tax=Sarcoptes scabiei TaxID=52283 RepID=A0A834R0R5_SARSC|nr:hypothetical protein SSS_06178 [Sarcoptes scabiei]